MQVDVGPGRLGLDLDLSGAGQDAGGRAEREQSRDRLEAAAPPAFLLSADDERGEPAPAAHDQRTGPRHPPSLWALTLTRSAPSAVEVRLDVAAGGGGVDVHRDARLPAQRDDVAHRLERADLVVGPLAVHERGARRGRRGQPGAERVDVDAAIGVDREGLGGRGTRRGVPDGRVLDRGAENGRARGGGGGAEDSGVDRFGRTGREHDLSWRRSEQGSHVPACLLERVTDDAPLLVEATGVGRRPPRPLGHGRQRLGPRRCGAGVIEVGASHRGSGRGGAGVVAPGP